jgi:heme oxygenase
MISPSSSPEILQRLRAETRPYHDALEQNSFNQELTAGAPSQEATEHFLRKLYGFLSPYEAQLRQHAFSEAWEIEHRYRAHLIPQDLQVSATSLPLCPVMPPLQTWPQLLGAMYVMEGSTLGGQVIARQLAKAGIPFLTYFKGYGERTGPMWKSFCHLLTQAATDANQDEIVQSASCTFQQLEAWLQRP